MRATARRPVIGVMGGAEASPGVQGVAEALGRAIAERGWVLLNGGRDAGVMAASAKGARDAGGLVIGVLPFAHEGDWPVSPDLDVAVFTGMGDARNVINVLSSHVVVACPGGAGTLSEVALAIKNDRPVVLLGWDVGTLLDDHPRRDALLHRAASVEDAITCIDRLLTDAGPGR